MKVFGFDDADILRGEMKAAEAEPWALHYPDELRGRLDWAFVSTRFAEARGELLRRMEEEGVDPEMIKAVRGLKANWLPVEEV